jgi:hypothetical protein
VAVENAPEEYGPWQWARQFGAATGRFGAEAFSLQENGMLRCPAGASLWLSEVRQENAFMQRAVYVASQTDCPHCELTSDNAWDEERKAIVLVGLVLSVVSCLHLRLLSESQSVSEQSGGWMWQVEHFVASGCLTGAGDMLRFFRSRKGPRAFSLLLVHLVPYVHIIAGVGTTGSCATLGSDRRICVSLSLAPSSSSTNTGGMSKQRDDFNEAPSPL